MTTPATPPAAPPPESAGLVGRVLSDRYRIEAVLGEGGMGAVYLAEHVLMHKRVAVKVLHPEMTRMPEVVARFEREAMAAAHIEHPNVAAATDFGKLDDGSFFLVLEYIEGTSLRDLLGEGPLEMTRALRIAQQMVSALVRAHSLGIVHRDLKPENVMLVEREGDRDFVKVLDFGIAKIPAGGFARTDGGSSAGQVLTQLGMVYGTPEYMAPEQALGQEVDARADLYALGVILYEMLTGLRPFDAESKVTLLGMKVTTDPPAMSTKNPEVKVPSSVEALVLRLLAKEASKRYQDARELGEAMDNIRLVEAKTEPPVRARTPLGSAPSVGVIAPREPIAALPRIFEATKAQALVLLSAVGRKLPPAVTHASRPVLLAAAGLGVLVVTLPLVVALRGSGGTTATADGGVALVPSRPVLEKLIGPPMAPAASLSAAVLLGPSALEELAARYDKDPAVLRALIRAHTAQKHGVEAMNAVIRLLDSNPSGVDDDEVTDAIQAAAQGPADAADAAFGVMTGRLGAKGADMLYDLSVTKGTSPRTISRAKQLLAKPDARASASPALQVALDLRAAKGCEAKKALLPRAKSDGDGRTLALLRPLLESRACGFLGLGDCWSCMRRDGQLGAAIAAIVERSGR